MTTFLAVLAVITVCTSAATRVLSALSDLLRAGLTLVSALHQLRAALREDQRNVDAPHRHDHELSYDHHE